MRACPVCKETFGDDLNFCDIDGAALEAPPGSAPALRSGERVWNLLGIGLLLGALVISAVSIVFLPRADIIAPREAPPANSFTNGATRSGDNAGAVTSPGPGQVPQTGAEPRVDNPEKVISDLKARERALPIPRTEDDTLTPKALASSTETDSKTATIEPKSPRAETSTAPADTGGSLGAAGTAGTAGTSGELKKEPPKREKERVGTKDGTNGTAGKEKKGGFLKVFKKIFGKN
jgi:hypothetical protein